MKNAYAYAYTYNAYIHTYIYKRWGESLGSLKCLGRRKCRRDVEENVKYKNNRIQSGTLHDNLHLEVKFKGHFKVNLIF